jgi:hypothetical protein
MRYDWERFGTLPPTLGLVALWYTSSISIIFTNKRLLSGHAFAFPFFMTACNNVCRHPELQTRSSRAQAEARAGRHGPRQACATHACEPRLGQAIVAVVSWAVTRHPRLRQPVLSPHTFRRVVLPIGVCTALDIGFSNWSLVFISARRANRDPPTPDH